MNKKELRCLDIEFRAVDNDNNEMIIEGYPITFNSVATHWGISEVVSEKSIDSETDMKDVPLRYNHNDTCLIMARTRNKSLKLEKDEKGLKMIAKLNDTQTNRDLYQCIKDKLIDKMSFAFTCDREEWDDKTKTRTILHIDKLYDVSVVDVPFYDSTSVGARNLDNFQEFAEKKNAEINAEKRKALIEKLKREELAKSIKC